MSRKLLALLGLVATSLLMIDPAFASGGDELPWEGPLEQIQESIARSPALSRLPPSPLPAAC